MHLKDHHRIERGATAAGQPLMIEHLVADRDPVDERRAHIKLLKRGGIMRGHSRLAGKQRRFLAQPVASDILGIERKKPREIALVVGIELALHGGFRCQGRHLRHQSLLGPR